MKIFFNSLIFCILLISQSTFAQNNWCATDEHNAELLKNTTTQEAIFSEQQREAMFEFARNEKPESGVVYTIPVVVHVIHHNCVGNISKEQIEDGIRVLNEDYRRMNSDTTNTRSLFKPFAVDIEVEFKLARLDPNGQCTDGIVRLSSPLSFGSRDDVKALSYWPSNKYFNVWIVNSIENSSGTNTTLGYAQFPGFGSWSTYGIVVRNSSWGTIGTSNSDGRTASHEVGHALGLYHTFQGGCGSNCSNSGDRICDTPPTQEATWGCSTTQNTCFNDQSGSGSPFSSNVVDQIENYMSYDACQNMFTAEQRDVMRGSLGFFSQLINLVSSSNLTATGTTPGFVAGTCTPKAYFCQPEVVICENQTVTYEDNSYNGSVTSRTWSFPGGTPASSSDSVVTVTYKTAGKYNATLTVSNSSGSNAKTVTNLISVQPALADFTSWRYSEDFEDDVRFNTKWHVESQEGKQWELTNKGFYTGANSVLLNNYIASVNGWLDALVSPSYDLSAIIGPRFSFKAAYARKSAVSSDILKLYYSINCGNSWSILTAYTSTTLASTTAFVTSEFVPTNQSEWKEFSANLPSFVATNKNVKFKFEFVSGGGNSIYIDDLNIESATGIAENNLQKEVHIFPNPATDFLQIQLINFEGVQHIIVLSDLSGREVRTVSSKGAGKSLQLDVSDLPEGLYFVRVNGSEVVRKVVIR